MFISTLLQASQLKQAGFPQNIDATKIAEKFNLTGATVSYHLTQLKKAELIVETKYKNFTNNNYFLKITHNNSKFIPQK